MTTPTPDEAPLDPTEAAALMHDRRTETTRREFRLIALIIFAWGFVWLFGYLALWTAQTWGGNPWFRIPDAAAWSVLGGLGVVAIVVSAVSGARMGRGRRGPSNRAGAMFGVSFAIGAVAITAFTEGLRRAGVSAEHMMLIYPAAYTLLIGALYMAGAGLTRSRGQYIAGIVLMATVVVATFVGTPQHLFVYALSGLVYFATAAAVRTGRVR